MIDWPRGPKYWIKDRTFYASIPFTWNLPDVKSRISKKSFLYDNVVLGGPATKLIPNYFKDIPNVETGPVYPGVLQKINPYATRTTGRMYQKL